MKGNMTITTLCLLLLAALVLQPVAVAQNCKNSVIAIASNSTFTIHNDGTVTDDSTGLMWMRCSLGQKWEGKNCGEAAASFSWAKGLKIADGFEFAGYTDWRLPNKNELESIVENHCFSPAIKSEVFPATPSAYFWSSSPYAAVPSAAWSVDFGFGLVNASVKSGSILVRLVRDPLFGEPL
jgi:hypothetical protein